MSRGLTVILVGMTLGTVVGATVSSTHALQQDDATATSEQVARESARLNEWLDARYEELLDFSPIEKTRLGRKDDYDRIDDFSERARERQLEWRRRTVRDLAQTFDYARLTPEAQTSYDLWLYELERAEAARSFHRRAYVFHQMRGEHTRLPQLLINLHRVDTEADMVAYITRIGEVARAIRQEIERAQLAAAEGVRPPRFAYDLVLEQAQALVTGAPFDGDGDAPLWSDATGKIDALVAAGTIAMERGEGLRADAAAALTEHFKPAYDALIAWLEAELPLTDEQARGVWALPDGPGFYAERLAASTTTELTAEEIHEIGLSEVERIHAEMEAIKAQVGFEGTLREFFGSIRSNPAFFFANTDEGRAAYLQTSRDHLDAIAETVPQFFGRTPRAAMVVRRVEAFREQPGAAQHYFPATPDGSRPGTYYVHLIDMTSMPQWDLESVAYHEGIPGHHLQISIAQELEGVPMLRTQFRATAFIEGWGLYAERLAKEMGGYQDPYSDLGRLGAEIWRAIRLVVDTGLHAKSWSQEEAVQYFLASGPTSEGQIRSEIRRYLVMPGQATAYTIGMLEILELRARAEMALADRFDIRDFHDTVLGGGALPLPILERRVDQWIASRAGDRTDGR